MLSSWPNTEVRGKLQDMDSSTPFDEALRAARQGDAGAIDLLTQRFYPTVKKLVHHRLDRDLRNGRPWLAARFSTGDVVHEVFLSVLRDLKAFAGESEGAFVGYLAMVVRNRLIDAVRFHEAERRDGRRLAPGQEERNHLGSATDPANRADISDQVEQLQRELLLFDEREQLLLRARIESLATFRELAEQLGYESESGARRAYYAAQARLVLVLKGR